MNENKCPSPFGLQFLHHPTMQIAAVEHIAQLRRSLLDLRERLLKRAHQRSGLVARLQAEEFADQVRQMKEHGYLEISDRPEPRPEVVSFGTETKRLEKQIELHEIEIERQRHALQVAIGVRLAN